MVTRWWVASPLGIPAPRIPARRTRCSSRYSRARPVRFATARAATARTPRRRLSVRLSPREKFRDALRRVRRQPLVFEQIERVGIPQSQTIGLNEGALGYLVREPRIG